MSIIIHWIHTRPEWVYFWITRSSSLAIPFQCRGYRIIETGSLLIWFNQTDIREHPSSANIETTRDRPGIKSCPKMHRTLADCTETATHIARLKADCRYSRNAIDNGNCVGKCCVEDWWMLVQQSCQNEMLVGKKMNALPCLALGIFHWSGQWHGT